MAKTTQRAFALSLAILFIVTTVGFTGVVLWQMQQDNKKAQDQTSQNDQANQQQQELPKEFMNDFNPLGDTRIAELKTEDKKVGDGAVATEASTVRVEYTGALAKDGSIFDSTSSRGNEPAEFSLDQVIQGFKQGITGMKVGGERRIFIPAALGYGDQGGGTVPADSDLVFDVKLVEVK
jgi:FKBP-type peptidyl-prolyl cis-trans isomerase